MNGFNLSVGERKKIVEEVQSDIRKFNEENNTNFMFHDPWGHDLTFAINKSKENDDFRISKPLYKISYAENQKFGIVEIQAKAFWEGFKVAYKLFQEVKDEKG